MLLAFMHRWGFIALALLFSPGCILEAVSLDGRPCPCVEGFVCDSNRQVCVRSLEAGDAGLDLNPDGGFGRTDATLGDVFDLPADAGEISDAEGRPDAVFPADAGPDAGDPPDAGADAGPTPCVTDRHCVGGTVCEGSICVPACTMGSCPANLPCDLATGHCFNAGAACSDSADCGSGTPVGVCVSGACQYGCGVDIAAGCVENRVCGSTGFCTVAPTCSVDADCGRSDFVCRQDTCVRRCDAPNAYRCYGSSACDSNTGQCSGLALGQDCQNDAACASGVCLLVGSSRFCTQSCGATSDCPLGTSCRRVDGARRCIRENAFSPPPSFDTPSGQACVRLGNTCQSLVCSEDNMCVERCSEDDHCTAFGTACVMQVVTGIGPDEYLQDCIPKAGLPVGATCTDNDNDQCASGICYRYADECVGPCCSDADCPSGEACVLYDVDQTRFESITVCRPKGGAFLYGQTCTDDLECEGVCGPRDPNNLAGARSCTTHCCTDADCADYPNGARCVTIPSPVGLRNICVPLVP